MGILVHQLKNTIRDGGSTALYTAYTVYTVDNVYTVQTALYCLNINMPIYIVREGENASRMG